MKKVFKFLCFLLPLLFSLSASGQIRGYDSLPYLKLDPVKVVSIRGDLTMGSRMETLAWAWNSSVACFPQTQARKFSGNHVLYATDLPSYSELVVTVVPDDENANFSLYAYEVGKIGEDNLVPNLSSCIRCEADHKWDYQKRGQTQDHTRTVKDLVAIRNPYQVVIGVVGADGLEKGGYTLQLKLNKQ